jgi:MinD-like ATPase involved in chromosome partitioning or flagellar assembly
MTQRSQILFTQGGKGGVGKTTVIAALAGWIRTKGFDPVLLDFDSENREKSSFQSFYPEAQKIDIRAPDSLDRVFHFLETPGTIVIADQGAGSGAETFSWFDRTAQIVSEFADVTSIGIVTKDPGSVASVLSWAYHLGSRVRYLIVLNELVRGSGFDAWCTTPEVQEFVTQTAPAIVALQNRNPDFEDMLRANHLTLEKVIDRRHSVDWFHSLTRIVQGRRYQQEAYDAFESVSHILLPSDQTEAAFA